MKCRVIRFKPDTMEQIPNIEYWFDTEAEAAKFVKPLQEAGERGWRIRWWAPFILYYATKGRSEYGYFHQTLESALNAAKKLKQNFRIMAWDEITKTYIPIKSEKSQ